MAETQLCFYCIAEKNGKPFEAATTYRGTAVCQIHAIKKHAEEENETYMNRKGDELKMRVLALVERVTS